MNKAWSAALLLPSILLFACGASDDAVPTTDPTTATLPDGATAETDGARPDPGDGGVPPRTDGGGGGEDGGGGGGVDASVPPGSCGTPNPQTGFIPSLSVRVGAATRTYALTVPAGYNGTRLYPLVIGFHGDGGNGAGYRASFAIEAQGQAAASAIFAWPNGTNNNNGHSFDQDHSPPTPNADVAFFDAMNAAIAATYCVDPKRVYAHGMSGGAYFVNQLGRWRGSALRAVAPQSGGGPFGNGSADFDPQTGTLKLGVPVAAFIVHGTSDGAVGLAEGQKSLDYWRRANKSAAGQAATTPSPCQKQNGGTKPVVFCAIPGMGHTIWTGAPAAIWQFFGAN